MYDAFIRSRTPHVSEERGAKLLINAADFNVKATKVSVESVHSKRACRRSLVQNCKYWTSPLLGSCYQLMDLLQLGES